MLRLLRVTQLQSGRDEASARDLNCPATMGQIEGARVTNGRIWPTPAPRYLSLFKVPGVKDLLKLACTVNSQWDWGELGNLRHHSEGLEIGTTSMKISGNSFTVIHAHTLWSCNSVPRWVPTCRWTSTGAKWLMSGLFMTAGFGWGEACKHPDGPFIEVVINDGMLNGPVGRCYICCISKATLSELVHNLNSV